MCTTWLELCLQPLWSVVRLCAQPFTLRIHPAKCHSQHSTTQKPKLLPFNQEMEAELENQKAKMEFHVVPTVSSADDLLGPVFSWKPARSWAIPEACFQQFIEIWVKMSSTAHEWARYWAAARCIVWLQVIHVLFAFCLPSFPVLIIYCLLSFASITAHGVHQPGSVRMIWVSLNTFSSQFLNPKQNILTELGWGVSMGRVPVRLKRRQVRVKGDPAVMVS